MAEPASSRASRAVAVMDKPPQMPTAGVTGERRPPCRAFGRRPRRVKYVAARPMPKVVSPHAERGTMSGTGTAAAYAWAAAAGQEGATNDLHRRGPAADVRLGQDAQGLPLRVLEEFAVVSRPLSATFGQEQNLRPPSRLGRLPGRTAPVAPPPGRPFHEGNHATQCRLTDHQISAGRTSPSRPRARAAPSAQ